MIPRSFNFFVDLSSIVAPSTILVRTFFLNPKLRNYEGFRSKSIPILANLSLLFERWKEIDEANFQRTTKTAWKKKEKKNVSASTRSFLFSALGLESWHLERFAIRRKITCAESARFIEFFKLGAPSSHQRPLLPFLRKLLCELFRVFDQVSLTRARVPRESDIMCLKTRTERYGFRVE